METERTKPAFSIASIIAIVAAVASLFVGAIWGFLLAVSAIIFGLFGVLMALSPGVRGGALSILSMLAGAIGIVVALFKAIGYVTGMT